MVEEITCVMCQQFPYSPKQCRKCDKLFCKHCQVELMRGSGVNSSDDPNSSPRNGRQATNRSQNPQSNVGLTPGFDVCCPNCQERGDFIVEVNKVLRNCIDFCEFPHRCYTDGKHSQIIWKTLLELQEHAMVECPKFGCDICYQEEYQHMTRAQLF